MNAEEKSAIDFLTRSAEHYRAKGSTMDAALTLGIKAMIERVCNERDSQTNIPSEAFALQRICAWMIDHGYATGHGDSIDGVLAELIGQVREHILKESSPPQI